MARVEVVHVDTDGNVDRPSIELHKCSGDQVVWLSQLTEFGIEFIGNNPFTPSADLESHKPVHPSGPIRDEAAPDIYRYKVGKGATLRQQFEARRSQLIAHTVAQGDDGEVIIYP